MTTQNRIYGLLGLLIALSIMAGFQYANAATPLPPAPATGYCSDGSNATGFYGVRGCLNVPPPDIDPLAMTTTFVRYPGNCSAVTTDASIFSNIFGRDSATAPINAQWPFKPGAIVTFTKPRGKHYGPTFSIPSNPGIARHPLVGVTYTTCNGTVSSSEFPWTLRVQGIGTIQTPEGPRPTPQPHGACLTSGPKFTQRALVVIDPSNGTNATVCNVMPGGTYRITLDTVDTNQQAVWIIRWQ